MTDYVALLRGIAPLNPKMQNAALRGVFEGLGFNDVRTVISSGNVLFASPERSASRLESQIEEALLDHLGAPCTTMLRTRRQIDDLARSGAFDGYADDEPTARCNVTFLKRRPPASQAPPDLGAGSELVALRDREVLTVVDHTGPAGSMAMARLERAYGTEMTTRTWKTVHRIATAFARAR
ncbi:MAG: DUF1697 domain-containing protein [Actinomycetota bacterium]|nr:DUF1697 domain-containing protein [Actinomycetota bacterium]